MRPVVRVGVIFVSPGNSTVKGTISGIGVVGVLIGGDAAPLAIGAVINAA